MRNIIISLGLVTALVLPATAGAVEVKRSIKGAKLTLSVPTDCTAHGSVLPAVLKVKLKKSARYEVKYVEWRIDGHKITTDSSAPYDVRLATTSIEADKSYTLEARMYTEYFQKKPKAKLSATVSTCPAV
jgi:hypothetical protein